MPLTRREWLGRAGVGLAAAPVAVAPLSAPAKAAGEAAFHYCLNTGTLMGHKLPLVELVEIAAQAGYHAIEPWVKEIREHLERGKAAADLRKRIADLGLSVESAIGFSDWINDDPQRRAAGLEQYKRDMELVAGIGGKRIAAPPVGATKTPIGDLPAVAERFRTLVDLAKTFGLVPELELWGVSKTLSRLGEAAYVLAEVDRPEACALLDVFHTYRSGSPWSGLRMFPGRRLPVFHMNDYPAEPAADKLTDADRVYPGDGVAPFTQILRTLRECGFAGFLSIELFNREYWKQDPLHVARTGLAKMQAVAAKAAL